MKFDETSLRAYVDGELSPDERDRVEVALAHDEALAAQVLALRASCLPYCMAFDAQPMPQVPDSLRRQVEGWTALAGAQSASVVPLSGRRHWLRMSWPGLAAAAAFMLGVFAPLAWQRIAGPAAPDHWIEAIATYQSLYTRETVGHLTDDPVRTREVLADFRIREGRSVSVPDLSSAGLTFKRIQPLAAGDAPLLQMVYLPADGKPVALCVVALRGRPDSQVATRRMEGMSVSTWQHGGLAYVLAADLPNARVEQLAARLAREEFPALRESAQARPA